MEGNKKVTVALIGLAAAARVIPHPWNFTPLVALGLYSGARSAKVRTGIAVTLAALLASDAVLGFYKGMWYVYLAAMIPVLLGALLKRREGVATLVAAGLISSLSFFALTNFGTWAMGSLYPHTIAGLGACYAAGIPFYKNQLAGDAFFIVALFGFDALLRRWSRPALQTA